jgi:hypothetical protein
MKFLFVILISSAIELTCSAQNFLFTPSVIERELPLDVYSIDQIDITPLFANDTAFLSYRLIENTCPASWEFILCDWSDCFTNMPNTDDMHPLPNGYDALIKISAHPHQTEGSGFLHFWIFPTGSMELHESIYFYYNTPNAASIRQIKTAQIQYQYIQSEIHISNAPIGEWKLFDSSGKLINNGTNSSSTFILEQFKTNPSHLILVWLESGQMLKILPAF